MKDAKSLAIATGLARQPELNPLRPPYYISRENYRRWLQLVNPGDLDLEISGYFDLAFDWYEGQALKPLPQSVHDSRDKIDVNVEDALKQTIDLEEKGDVELYTGMGFDGYGIAKAPVHVALETALYYHGKPLGLPEGTTTPKPDDYRFAVTKCSIRTLWGADNYLSSHSQTAGGLLRDLNDEHTLLVRRNGNQGYTLFRSFACPIEGKSTATSTALELMTLRPRSDENEVDFRICVRRNGQNYQKSGRRECGFKRERFLTRLKQFAAGAKELNETRKISADVF